MPTGPPVKLPPFRVTMGCDVVLVTEAPSAIRRRLPLGASVVSVSTSSGPLKKRRASTEPAAKNPLTSKRCVPLVMLPRVSEISGSVVSCCVRIPPVKMPNPVLVVTIVASTARSSEPAMVRIAGVAADPARLRTRAVEVASVNGSSPPRVTFVSVRSISGFALVLVSVERVTFRRWNSALRVLPVASSSPPASVTVAGATSSPARPAESLTLKMLLPD